ncbi:MAG: nicotinate-nucleotide adenylyltransferase [Deltaproteobacteria bacterium]|nr:MAG: nicotinate-nucleotide adenylyltransferase [Deltaproteobacteria bacterium]
MGLLGGTFNPIHLGHLRGAEEIRESFGLERVVFIPAAIPPHKEMEGIVNASHRLEMVQLATRANPWFSFSDIELKRSGKSYSVDTIRYFREIHPGPLYFILGGDAFFEIETWMDFQNLFSLCHFIVMTRPGSQRSGEILELPKSLVPLFRYDPGARAWIHVSGNRLHLKGITYLDISSTQIRGLVGRGESIRYLLPAEVEAYIEKESLYRKGGRRAGRS